MIHISSLAGQKVAVFGLARSGLASAVALKRSGAKVLAWDDNEKSREHAVAADIDPVDLYQADWSDISALVLSPGIPLTHPEPHPIVAKAREAGVDIIGDMELLARTHLEANTIGITGTNGKSTTTALVGHMLARAGEKVEIGGNLGIPVLDLMPLKEDGSYVLEMSSYQLDLIHSLSFDVAVLLNVSPDHLDRHGDMAGYIAAKKRLFNGQGELDTAIIGVDDDICRGIYEQVKDRRETIPISGERAVPGGVYAQDGILYDDTKGKAEVIVDLNTIPRLPGIHNAQNAAGAAAVGLTYDLDHAAIVTGLRTFPGLAHRQEVLAIIDGVSYINDSKATNDESAARALACYGNIYWIAGGRAKQGGLEATKPYLDRVRHAYLIGEAANDFAHVLEKIVPVTLSGELSRAVGEARRNALDEIGDGAVVLLSPACASFDQFDNFEARGNAFREMVHSLPGDRREVGV